jgi:hypothetical protein
VDSDKPLAPLSWVQRPKRVFAIHIEICSDCGGTLRVIVCIKEPLLIADSEHPLLDFEAHSSFAHLQAASIRYRIAIGPHAGRKALTLYTVPPVEDASAHGLVACAGFSLHAGTVCETWQRIRLEWLCRYITRPPVATKSFSVDRQGRGVYRYKQRFATGQSM